MGKSGAWQKKTQLQVESLPSFFLPCNIPMKLQSTLESSSLSVAPVEAELAEAEGTEPPQV